MRIAGIDIGTTACKVSVFEQDGTFVRALEREFSARSGVGAFEVDVEALFDCIASLLGDLGRDAESLAAIGVTSFGETCALVGEDGKPLRGAMLYTDVRGTEEALALSERFSAEFLAETTGLSADPMYSLPKILWVRAHEPELFAKIKYIFLIQDYIVWRLTGRRQIDWSLASRTLCFDVRKHAWNRELLEYAGLSADMFSAPVPTGTKAGPLRAELADALSLPQGVEVVSISHDQVAAVVGAGAMRGGMAVDGGGTVQCVTPVFEGFPDGARMQEGKFSVVPTLRDNLYVSYAFLFTGGALLQWFRDKLCLAGEKGGAFYGEMNREVPDGPSGLLALPHFDGAATPYMDPNATGAILGLSVRTTRAQVYHALMEGVAYEMRVNLEMLENAGIRVKELRATGGAARSPQWLQMKADILNVPITVLSEAQCGTVGCVMLAGMACGLYASLPEAEAIFVHPGKTYAPRADKHAEYMKQYARYRRLYAAVKEVMA